MFSVVNPKKPRIRETDLSDLSEIYGFNLLVNLLSYHRRKPFQIHQNNPFLFLLNTKGTKETKVSVHSVFSVVNPKKIRRTNRYFFVNPFALYFFSLPLHS